MILRSKLILISFLLLLLSYSKTEAYTLSSIDSIGVERDGDKLFILHKVSYGETLFSVSRKYQVAVDEILGANEVLKQGLKSGQTIRVPKNIITTSTSHKSLHKVASGETLFSISKKYGVSVESLQKWNNLKSNSLKAGQSLVISESSSVNQQVKTDQVTANESSTPISTVASSTSSKEKLKNVERKAEASNAPVVNVDDQPEKQKVNQSNSANSTVFTSPEWITHTVKAGETLFSLSNQYDKSVEELIKWNSLATNNLKSGQILKVGRSAELQQKSMSSAPVKNSVSGEQIRLESNLQNTSGGFKNIKETGLAELIEGTGDHKKYLVLHREAPIGSVIRVKNEENNLTIFARVVGTLPETGDNSKLLIKLSQAAYDQLKAVNARFPVEILY